MVHDRVAFGGTLLGLGVLYVWLTVFPLAAGESWAWWVWLISAAVGFASFLGYLGTGTSTPGTAWGRRCSCPSSPSASTSGSAHRP